MDSKIANSLVKDSPFQAILFQSIALPNSLPKSLSSKYYVCVYLIASHIHNYMRFLLL